MCFSSLPPFDLPGIPHTLAWGVCVCVCGSGLMSWRHNQQEAPLKLCRVGDSSRVFRGMTAGCTRRPRQAPLFLFLFLAASVFCISSSVSGAAECCRGRPDHSSVTPVSVFTLFYSRVTRTGISVWNLRRIAQVLLRLVREPHQRTRTQWDVHDCARRPQGASGGLQLLPLSSGCSNESVLFPPAESFTHHRRVQPFR